MPLLVPRVLTVPRQPAVAISNETARMRSSTGDARNASRKSAARNGDISAREPRASSVRSDVGEAEPQRALDAALLAGDIDGTNARLGRAVIPNVVARIALRAGLPRRANLDDRGRYDRDWSRWRATRRHRCQPFTISDELPPAEAKEGHVWWTPEPGVGREKTTALPFLRLS